MKIIFSKGLVLLLILLLLSVAGSAVAKEQPKKAPKFPRKGVWLQLKSDAKPSLDGRVSVVYFWDYTSVNSIREMGILKRWEALYRPYGFQILWIHAPEFQFAKDSEAVQAAVDRYGLSGPVFLDNEFKAWEAYGNHSWPTKYLINGKKQIIETYVGEGQYAQVESRIREALNHLDERMVLPDPVWTLEEDRFDAEKCGIVSSETYVGYKRAGWWGGKIANQRWISPGETLMFKDRGERVERGFFVEGLWENREDDFIHSRETEKVRDYLGLIYVAHEVYAVLSQANQYPSKLYVTRDGESVPAQYRGPDIQEDPLGQTYLVIEEPRLYYVLQNENLQPHELRVWSTTMGDAINSFSFSNLCLTEFEHL